MVIKPTFALLSGASVIAVVWVTQAQAPAVVNTPRVVTLASAGKTITLRPGSLALLRLDNRRWAWSAPHARGVAVTIEAVDYERDPGFDEWKIRTATPGRVSVAVRGSGCNGCSNPHRVVRFTIVVSHR